MKTKTQFRCSSCDASAPKWQGRCTVCGEWGVMEEVTVEVAAKGAARAPSAGHGVGGGQPTAITRISVADMPRFESGFDEVDRVLGGGIVPGSTILIGGDPGIGKSTLMTMLGHRLAGAGRRALYVTGEESETQVRLRAERLQALHDDLLVVAESSLSAIIRAIESTEPAVCILDSIQTVHCADVGAVAGTVSQVRESAAQLVTVAKRRGTAIFLVGHVTKEGALAGPRTLEHVVDVVLNFDGDRYQAFRLLRGVKNRYGAAGEVAVLEMTGRGLREVRNPSVLFLRDRSSDEPGSAVTASIVGTRTFLVELQALVSPAVAGGARRVLTGVDTRRAQLVMAILERHGGLELASQDVYLNAVGGLTVDEPGADLALALSLASAMKGRALSEGIVAIGELGLMGEVRGIGRLDARLAEAERLGFRRAIVPKAASESSDAPRRRTAGGFEVLRVERLGQALEAVGLD